MAKMLDLDWKFKTMINMLSTVMEKVDNIQNRRTGKASRVMETLRKNKMEMLEIKNTVPEMRTAFDGLISR